MKNFKTMIAASAVAVSSVILFGFHGEQHKTLEIGDEMPKQEIKMKAIDDKAYTLKDIAKAKGTLVIFSCNTCPFVVGRGEKTEGWQGRYNGIQEMCDKNEIGMILVNSNEAKREGDDSYEEMVKFAKEKGQKSIYAVDKHHLIADAFGAKTTPHVFLFDNNKKLVYTGAIDDNVDSAKDVSAHYLTDAISEMASGKKITNPKSKALGCSIKRITAHKH